MTRYYSFLKESQNILNPKTKWTYTGQYNIIKQILEKYPTAKDFKNAVINTNNKKAINIIESLPDNCPKKEYIDFLQKIYIKYSNVGKFLLALGIGSITSTIMSYALRNKHDSEFRKDIEENELERNIWKKSIDGDHLQKNVLKKGLDLDKYLDDVNNRVHQSTKRLIQKYPEYSDLIYKNPAFPLDDLRNKINKDNFKKDGYSALAGMGIGGASVLGLSKLFDKKKNNF